jgi:hypothetical protein
MKANNMRKLITCLAAVLLVVGAQSLMAQSATNSTNQPGTQTPGKHKKNADILKLVGLTSADVKGLTPKERQEKIKAAATTVEAELQAKKASGTLTAEGQTRLDRIEKYLAHANHTKAAVPTEN